jgi:hypothetical protein
LLLNITTVMEGGKFMTRSGAVGLLSALPLLLTAASGDAASVRGQVLAISYTECHAPRPCEGSVILWNEGAEKVVQVRRDTRITRAGEPAHFAEIGVGNLVTLDNHGAVTYASPMASPHRGIQAP